MRILARMKNHLEEGIRHYHLVLTQLAMFLIQKYRSADNINLAILLRPVAALLLYRVPYPRIQTVVLRTHIGHQETFIHRLLTPFVVTSRTHVSPVQSTVIKIRQSTHGCRHLLIIIPEEEFISRQNALDESPFIKIEKDPRVTKVGRVLRKYSLDELPQLVNILKGDMSVVGNRPLPLYEAERLTNDESIERFMAPAGLTGLWQVEKRGDAGKLSAKERKELDLKYGREFSFFLDMKILFKTLTAFVQKGDV